LVLAHGFGGGCICCVEAIWLCCLCSNWDAIV